MAQKNEVAKKNIYYQQMSINKCIVTKTIAIMTSSY